MSRKHFFSFKIDASFADFEFVSIDLHYLEDFLEAVFISGYIEKILTKFRISLCSLIHNMKLSMIESWVTGYFRKYNIHKHILGQKLICLLYITQIFRFRMIKLDILFGIFPSLFNRFISIRVHPY